MESTIIISLQSDDKQVLMRGPCDNNNGGILSDQQGNSTRGVDVNDNDQPKEEEESSKCEATRMNTTSTSCTTTTTTTTTRDVMMRNGVSRRTTQQQKEEEKEAAASASASSASALASASASASSSSVVMMGPRERLKRHRRDVAGHVWIPDMWGQEDFLKDWIDCNAFDASLVNRNIMLARASLMQQPTTRPAALENSC